MTKDELEKIREACDYAYLGQKAINQMGDFERMVNWPTARRLFEAKAPEYVRTLLQHIDALERDLAKPIMRKVTK